MVYLPCPKCGRDDVFSAERRWPARRCVCGWWAAVGFERSTPVVVSGRPGRNRTVSSGKIQSLHGRGDVVDNMWPVCYDLGWSDDAEE
jgi:hypothetical protein